MTKANQLVKKLNSMYAVKDVKIHTGKVCDVVMATVNTVRVMLPVLDCKSIDELSSAEYVFA